MRYARLVGGRRGSASALVLLASMMSACVQGGGEAGHLGGTGDFHRYYLSNGSELTLRLTLRVNSGELLVQVIDPSRDERFQVDLTGPDVADRELPLTGEQGQWDIHFSSVDVDGSYAIDWHE